MSSEQTRSPIAIALDELFDQTKKDGTPKYTSEDVRAMRGLFLLEIVRRNQFDRLDEYRKVELAVLLDQIGINENTPPKNVEKMVRKYFMGLKINPDMFVEVDRILRKAGKIDEAIEATAAAYNKLTEKEAARAPAHDEEAPEDSTPAQSLQQQLGVKVRI